MIALYHGLELPERVDSQTLYVFIDPTRPQYHSRFFASFTGFDIRALFHTEFVFLLSNLPFLFEHLTWRSFTSILWSRGRRAVPNGAEHAGQCTALNLPQFTLSPSVTPPIALAMSVSRAKC